MSKLRMAVVGAGHLGRIHAQLLVARPEISLVGIADPVAAARHKLAGECGCPAVADYRQLLDHVDAAVIATPTRTHHQVALDFLHRGLPVLIEKPLAVSVREADELVAAARRRETTLQVGHIERFNPALLAAQPHLHEPTFVHAVRSGGFTARSTDIGVVLDLMIHDLDVLLALVESRVHTVTALGLSLLGRHEDVAHAYLEFENGCVAQLSASRVDFGPPRREMHVYTKTIMADIDFSARRTRLVRPSPAVLRHEVDVERMTAAERAHLRDHLAEEYLRVTEPAVESRNALVDEHQDFIDSIRQQRKPRVDGAAGRDALVVAERVLAALQSRSRAAGPLSTPPLPHPIIRGPHWQGLVETQRGRRAS